MFNVYDEQCAVELKSTAGWQETS